MMKSISRTQPNQFDPFEWKRMTTGELFIQKNITQNACKPQYSRFRHKYENQDLVPDGEASPASSWQSDHGMKFRQIFGEHASLQNFASSLDSSACQHSNPQQHHELILRVRGLSNSSGTSDQQYRNEKLLYLQAIDYILGYIVIKQSQGSRRGELCRKNKPVGLA